MSIACRLIGTEVGVRRIEKQQVLTFDVEDDSLRVGSLGSEYAGIEHRIQQERGVARLLRHPRDTADVDVGPLRAVHKIEIDTGSPLSSVASWIAEILNIITCRCKTIIMDSKEMLVHCHY